MEAVEFSQFVQDESSHLSGPSKDISVRRWTMDKGHQIRYQNDQFHTLSLYLAGGNENIRTDRPASRGSTGSFCFMPQTQGSVWKINQQVTFAHLYFSNSFLQRYCASAYQVDTRFIELEDQLFLEDSELRSAFLNCLLARQSQATESDLAIEQLSYEVIQLVVEKFAVFRLPAPKPKGGLSARARRLIYHQINDRLGEKITLAELADSVGLSPYHFARMFKLSFGESPARFIDWMRIEKVKALLATKAELCEISVQVGFAHQSHMTQRFKHWVGVTPARYRSDQN
ncbi:MAG: AraC family transcriptional regulator [Pseudomonadota bacterium]